MGTSTFSKVLSSKTVWGAAAMGVMGVLPVILPMIPPGTKTGALITLVLMAFTIYRRIQAQQPLGPVIDQTIAQTVEAVHVLGISTTVPTTLTGKVDQIANVTAVVKAIQ